MPAAAVNTVPARSTRCRHAAYVKVCAPAKCGALPRVAPRKYGQPLCVHAASTSGGVKRKAGRVSSARQKVPCATHVERMYAKQAAEWVAHAKQRMAARSHAGTTATQTSEGGVVSSAQRVSGKRGERRGVRNPNQWYGVANQRSRNARRQFAAGSGMRATVMRQSVQRHTVRHAQNHVHRRR